MTDVIQEKCDMKIIAHMESDFPSKFGIPRQSGRAEKLVSRIVFEPEYRVPEALRGIEEFSHLWVIWEFSANIREKWTPTVRPPRLGGNKRTGVFATRSPFRPNPLGLSCVRLLACRQDEKVGPVLYVGGADLMDGTPIYDIKPYIRADLHPDARCGFVDTHPDTYVTVNFPDEYLEKVPEDKREALLEILREDPRPAYQNDPERVYGLPFAGVDVHFKVSEGILTVCGVDKFPE